MAVYSHVNLAPLRKARGLSQQQLAEMIGAHLVTISKLETGKTPLSANWLMRFADAFQVRPTEIDAEFSDRKVFVVRKQINEYGTVRVVENGPLVDLQDADNWAAEVEWISVVGDSLYPVYREGDLLKVAYEANAEDINLWAYQDRICVISVESSYRKAFEIVVVPIRFDEDKVDVAHLNGRIERGLEFFRIGVVNCVYPRGSTGGQIEAEFPYLKANKGQQG